MYLKSLILKGFKSFADRSVISLEPGITAVVGPNGSGKSNISDSVLWVLGERNAKNLRGQAMEDVIFAGSSARKPQGLAEVNLVLDNTDGTLPVDFSEVSITRRMYRSGESEYLINGASCRRMDVLDVLHDSGLGTGTHSIISQGHLSGILESKPEDRRALIEEAAGVLKHKQRKAKSERKLEKMDGHLARVKDITAEVERQIKPLERKAKRALAYQDLSVELADLNLRLAVDDLRVLQRQWDGIVSREAECDQRMGGLHKAIGAAEDEVERLQNELESHTADVGRRADLHRRTQSVAERTDSTVLLFHERKRSMQSYITEMQLRVEGDERKAGDLLRQRNEAAEALASTQTAEAAAAEKLESARTRAQQAGETRRHMESAIGQVTHDRQSALAEREEVRARQARTMEVLSSNRAHQKLIGAHADEITQQLESARQAAQQAQQAAEETRSALDRASAQSEAARAADAEAFALRADARQAADAAREEAMQAAAEAAALEELERARDEANPLLSWLLDNQDAWEKRCRPLIELIDVPDDLSDTVELLLGADIAALVVDDVKAAEEVADRLAGVDASGSVCLVPQRESGREMPKAPAGTARLADLVRGEGARGAIECLLGDVLVCDSAQQARSVAAQVPSSCCATRDGFVVWPGGKVTYARKASDQVSLLARHRSLDEARQRLKSAAAARQSADERLQQAEESLRAAQAESLKASQSLAELQGKSQSAEAEQKRSADNLEALERESASLDEQRAAAASALAQAEPDAKQLEERLAELNERIDAAKEDLDAKRAAFAPARREAEDAETALSQAKLESATCTERATYASRMLLAREQEIEQARSQGVRAREVIAAKQAALERIDPLIAVFNRLSDAAKRRVQSIEEQTAASQSSSSGMHDAINAARAAARKAHDDYDAANARLGDVRVEKGRMEMQVESAISTITVDCATPLETALELPELEERQECEASAFKLQRRITNMGTINPDAAVEYEQLKERYDYLAGQLDDMLAARRSLAKIVSVIDARMKDDFVDTFNQVDANYREIFSALFPGGSGSLSLVDPDDPENTGVEVNAQPHGKRILKMSLMSGGERSLTAMALLFAVYKTRSTPFYILDEVEAALDDTNLRRLLAYLDSMRDHTQFIMITHQRRTMEMADVLYGISMQADGVTKVVSQRLEHALQHAEG